MGEPFIACQGLVETSAEKSVLLIHWCFLETVRDNSTHCGLVAQLQLNAVFKLLTVPKQLTTAAAVLLCILLWTSCVSYVLSE